jgi:uncharacterized protein (TIGR02996 family)
MNHAEEAMWRGFLEAIRETPDDDTPRLILADWLDDHDDPDRAEFIRLQCELARLSSRDEQTESLQSRERELLARHRETWLGPLAKACRSCQFHRGFPEDITVRPKVIVDLAAEFESRVPAGQVVLDGGYGDPLFQQLTHCPATAWISGLKYAHPQTTESGLHLLAESAGFPNLRSLRIDFAFFTTETIRALITSPHRRALRRIHLHVFGGRHTELPDVATELARPDVPFRLESLSLQTRRVGPNEAVTLANTGNLAELRELDLQVNNIGDPGAIALARSPCLRRLDRLNLHLNGLTSHSIQELVGSPLLEGIRHLALGCNKIGDRGAAILATSPQLASLETLGLYRADITDRGAEALAASPHLANLRSLELSVNALTDRGSQALFDSPHLARLELISIGGLIVRDKIISQRQRKLWQKRLGKKARV